MTASRPSICFIVESGTDARLVEGLASRARLTVLARAIPGGRAVSQPTGADVVVGPSGRAAFALRTFRELRHLRCDAVLVQGYGLAALAANVAARLDGTRCLMLVCSPIAEYYETRRTAGYPFSRLALMALQALGHLNGRIGQGYIVLSQYLLEVVRRYSPNAPVHVVPVYGVDLERFTATAAPREQLRNERGLPSSGQVIFSSSRIAPEKDVLTLLDAFSRLVREGRDVYLLNRSGGFREFLEQAAKAGVRERVIATDAVDPRGELQLDYAAVDVCVQASRAEGLGFSVLEAMACGRPVVASSVGGLRETVRDGVTGWSVPAGDPAALASALRDALDHPDEARRRAAAGAAMVRRQFESNAAFDRVVAVISAGGDGTR
jgi:glycosyltransferase involved in cell wall biosynthesis